MVIDFNKNNVYVLAVNDSADTSTKRSLNELVSIVKYSDRNRSSIIDYDIKCNSKAILTNLEYDFKQEFNSRRTNQYDYKNVFIEKTCNIPTIDLQLNGITRKRTIESAEACIIDVPKFNSGYRKYTILYSLEQDSFIIIEPVYFWRWGDEKLYDQLKPYFENPDSNNATETLIKHGIIPESYVIVHYDRVSIISDDKLYSFLVNKDKYHNIIYEDEYINYLSESKEPLTLEVLSEIEKLIQTRNRDNINMALQLLYSYDPREFAYSTIRTIEQCSEYVLKYLPFYQSTKFDAFLSRIGYNKKDLYSNGDHARNILFELCGSYDKEIILKEIFDRFNKTLTSSLKRIKDFDFLRDVKIENMKIYYNGQDYLNRGEQE